MQILLIPFARLAVANSARQQKRSALWDPSHWGAAVGAAGHLEFDGTDLAELVDAVGSPLLAVSRSRLLSDAKRFGSAVHSSNPGSFIACSYKTNCIPGVLRELHDAGFGAEVISPYELWLANRLDVPAERIIVNGVNKDDAFLEEAVQLGVASINVDEIRELDRLGAIARRLGRRARVSLRLKVNPGSHFGFRLETGEAMRAASVIAAHPETFDFAGLHFHELADNDDAERHAGYVNIAMSFAAEMRACTRLETAWLNVGGGYAVPTVKVMSRFEYARQRLLQVPPRPPDPEHGSDLDAYMRRLNDAVEDGCKAHGLPKPRLLFEPGRILFSQSHVLLTRVHSIKTNRNGPEFAMTDAGKILVSYPCDYEYHQMFVANRMRAPCAQNYHLMGRLCTSADLLGKNRCLPRLSAGDVIAIMDAGAYFTSYSSNFAYPRPEIVMLDGGQVRTLRQRETFDHLTAMDNI